jgi:hypothetical protein
MTPTRAKTLRRRKSAHLHSAQEIADELHRRGGKRITRQRVHLAGMRR